MGVPETSSDDSLEISVEQEMLASWDGQKDGKILSSEGKLLFVHQAEIKYQEELTELDRFELIHHGPSDIEILAYHMGDSFKKFRIHEDIEVADEFYFHLKAKLISPKDFESFKKHRVEIKSFICNTMFEDEVIARFIDGSNKFFEGEVLEAVLVGRYCPDFHKHHDGILVVSNKRIFFFNQEEVVRSLEKFEYKSCRIIKAFEDDSEGPQLYDFEFNDSNLLVTVKTDRHIKIEAFYSVLEPGKKLNEQF